MKKKKLTKSTALKVIKTKKTISLPTLPTHSHTKCAKTKRNTPAYYHCLAQTCQGKNITKACGDCKKNSQALATARQKEITNIKNAWKEISLSLTKLVPKN